MGVVYRGRHSVIRTQSVALKKPVIGDDPTVRTRFKDEAELWGKLQHSNIAVMYQYLEHEEDQWIAMEYFELGTVRELIGKEITDQERVVVLRDVLHGLEHAHERGVIHRDLKPENLMRSVDGHVRIADFGIARALDDSAHRRLTAPGMFQGGPAYVPPEVVQGEDAKQAADLYGVGVVAYELLTGRVPFAKLPGMAILVAKVNHPAPPIQDSRPDLSQDLCRWVSSLLQRQPEKRHSSATESLRRLEDISEASWEASWIKATLPTTKDPGPSQDPAPLAPPSRFARETTLAQWSTRGQRAKHALSRRRNLLVMVGALTAVLSGFAVTKSIDWWWTIGGLLALAAGLVITSYFDEREAFFAGRESPEH